MSQIPFNIPYFTGKESMFIQQAIETKKISNFGFLKLRESTGTGFAQPKTKPWEKEISRSTEPKKSKWDKGFNVSLPDSFAVLSPLKNAISP